MHTYQPRMAYGHHGQMYREPMYGRPDYGRNAHYAQRMEPRGFDFGGIGLAGLGMAALGSGLLGPLSRVALPLGGGYLGYTQGADILRNTGIGQAAVGWLSRTPVGGFLGADPFRPVGGALGALAGYSLSRMFS